MKKNFSDLKEGMHLIATRNHVDVVKKGVPYKIANVSTKLRNYVDIRAEDGHLFRVFKKDYDNGMFEYFPLFADYMIEVDDTLPFISIDSTSSLWELQQPKPKGKTLEISPKDMSANVQKYYAKMLVLEQQYLLDSLRTTDDVVENEKDFLRLKEIHEELKGYDYLIIHEVLERDVTWIDTAN